MGERGGQAPGTTGLYHLAILYPTRAELGDALRRLMKAGSRASEVVPGAYLSRAAVVDPWRNAA